MIAAPIVVVRDEVRASVVDAWPHLLGPREVERVAGVLVVARRHVVEDGEFDALVRSKFVGEMQKLANALRRHRTT